MPGNHPVTAVGRQLRKVLLSAFPTARDLCVVTSGCSRWNGFEPPSVVVSWRGEPARDVMVAAVAPFVSASYRLEVVHRFECLECGREHPTGPDDTPTACPNLQRSLKQGIAP